MFDFLKKNKTNSTIKAKAQQISDFEITIQNTVKR